MGDLGADEALDAIVSEVTPRTRLLAVSHVLWTTGVTLDVHALKERTGLPVLVDGAQSVGAIPVAVGALDYYTVSGQKWLCGPDTTGALYVADVDSLRVARAELLRAGVLRARRPLRPARRRAAASTPAGSRSRR